MPLKLFSQPARRLEQSLGGQASLGGKALWTLVSAENGHFGILEFRLLAAGLIESRQVG